MWVLYTYDMGNTGLLGGVDMLTGTFLGAMIASSAVLVAFVMVQQFFYWRYFEDRSEWVSHGYTVVMSGVAGFLAMLFSYRVEEEILLDARLIPILLLFMWKGRHPGYLPFLALLLIAGGRFAFGGGELAVWTAVHLLVITVCLSLINRYWLQEQSKWGRVWSLTLIGNLLNVALVAVSGLVPFGVFLQSYAGIWLAGNVLTTVVLVVVFEMIHREVRTRDAVILASNVDHLTGLHGRLALEQFLHGQFERAVATGGEISVAALDIDFFTRINDSYGEEVGDLVLKRIALIIQETIRSTDFASRYGEEDFLIVFPDLDLKHAWELAHRIRFQVEQMWVEVPGGRKIHVTISVGVAALSETSPKTLSMKAIQRLYLAKTMGRNRTIAEDKPGDGIF